MVIWGGRIQREGSACLGFPQECGGTRLHVRLNPYAEGYAARGHYLRRRGVPAHFSGGKCGILPKLAIPVDAGPGKEIPCARKNRHSPLTPQKGAKFPCYPGRLGIRNIKVYQEKRRLCEVYQVHHRSWGAEETSF